jgi:hypothetical protein
MPPPLLEELLPAPLDEPLEPPLDEPLEPPLDEPLEPPLDEPLEPPLDEPLEPPLDEPLEPPLEPLLLDALPQAPEPLPEAPLDVESPLELLLPPLLPLPLSWKTPELPLGRIMSSEPLSTPWGPASSLTAVGVFPIETVPFPGPDPELPPDPVRAPESSQPFGPCAKAGPSLPVGSWPESLPSEGTKVTSGNPHAAAWHARERTPGPRARFSSGPFSAKVESRSRIRNASTC